ncbi:YciI family protein [Micromonospora sp. NPDC051543]|uniref:YciI family protein n=1 Tax=Micromonospora sp. NPDC051543 TaxID=3364287 RepID=UPI003793E86B
MRFLTLLRTAENIDAGPPPDDLLRAMQKFVEEMVDAQVLVSTAGLAPTVLGARVRLSHDGMTVTDGPFTETKEMIASYALIDVPTKSEAVELSMRFLQLHHEYWNGWEGEAEIRQLVDPQDLTPEAWRQAFVPVSADR